MDNKKLAVVVDDDPMVRNLLERILSSLGFETRVFESALDVPCKSDEHDCQFEEGPPDVLITDIKMPGMNGIDFIRKCRKNGCCSKKIGIMAGYWQEYQGELADELECRKFQKPFAMQEIIDWVNEE